MMYDDIVDDMLFDWMMGSSLVGVQPDVVVDFVGGEQVSPIRESTDIVDGDGT